MRQRIEDLGRLAVMLNNVCQMDAFNLYKGRNKDFVDEFYTWSQDQQVDFLHKMIYSIDELSNELNECHCIALGNDWLNDDGGI